MADLDPQFTEWLGAVLALRDERLSAPHGDGTSHSRFWFNQVCPVIRGGVIFDDGCPLPHLGPLGVTRERCRWLSLERPEFVCAIEDDLP